MSCSAVEKILERFCFYLAGPALAVRPVPDLALAQGLTPGE